MLGVGATGAPMHLSPSGGDGPAGLPPPLWSWLLDSFVLINVRDSMSSPVAHVLMTLGAIVCGAHLANFTTGLECWADTALVAAAIRRSGRDSANSTTGLECLECWADTALVAAAIRGLGRDSAGCHAIPLSHCLIPLLSRLNPRQASSWDTRESPKRSRRESEHSC